MTVRSRRTLLALAVGLGLAGCHRTPPAPAGPTVASVNASLTAKILCSGVFIAGRDPAEVLTDDVRVDGKAVLASGAVTVRRQPPAVVITEPGIHVEAVYRQGVGCTLLNGASEAEVYGQYTAPPAPAVTRSTAPWPDGDGGPGPLPTDVNATALDAALTYAFSEPAQPAAPAGGQAPQKLIRDTRAVVIAWNGRLIAERYAAPFTATTPQLGYSMTKSLINALTGILVREGKLSVDEHPPVPEWRAGDPRTAITLDDMLHMSTGLQFVEAYSDQLVDTVLMLYAEPDAAHYAAEKPLLQTPGSVWQYSSGTTNLISRIDRQAVGGALADYFTFPQRALFSKVGADSAVMEPDASGTFLGSTFMYATARDWARLGQLYLDDGVWHGERIFPEGWVKYTATPAPHAPDGRYGAQFWLNAGDPADPSKRSWPHMPTDTFAMIGYQGQAVVIIPSRHLVVVRLGETMPDPPDPGKGDSDAFSLDHFVDLVLQALPAAK
ncbi:MAG: serine hydrolase [Acidobacteriota bacterium]|nr:serine hydrolase [Acidobacteriota bacterium]